MSRVFIHYGSKKYDTEHFTPIQNCYLRNKPIGGLWASDVNAPYGWDCDSILVLNPDVIIPIL